MAEHGKKTVLTSDNAPKAVGPYSLGIRTGCFMFISGQLGLIPGTGKFAGDDIESQTRQALTNIKNALADSGADMSDVVKATVFLASMDDFQKMNAVYAEFFKIDPPARSTVEVGALPLHGLIEIEVIAKTE